MKLKKHVKKKKKSAGDIFLELCKLMQECYKLPAQNLSRVEKWQIRQIHKPNIHGSLLILLKPKLLTLSFE